MYKADALDLTCSPLIIQITGHFRHILHMLQNLALSFYDPFGVKDCIAFSKLWEIMVFICHLELGLAKAHRDDLFWSFGTSHKGIHR